MGCTTPTYRRRVIRGKAVAYVTLPDSLTGKRKDVWLGDYDSPESYEKYHEVLKRWEAMGRRIESPAPDITVVELLMEYDEWYKKNYSRGEYLTNYSALRVVRELFGREDAAKMGPQRLAAVREAMVKMGWSRRYVNRQVQRVIAAWKWGSEHELVPGACFYSMKTLRSLRKGRTTAPELPPVKPVPDEYVDAIEPWVPSQVWALIQLQRLTGARGDELLKLRPRDIDRSDKDAWIVNVDAHKTAWLGKKRVLYFGPKAQEIIGRFLLREEDAYLFSPQEAERERRPRAKLRRGRPVGTRYSPASYRRAIQRACDRADRWAHGGAAVADEDRLIPRWHPHQLRHNAATVVNARYGLVASQLLLGHSSARVTDAVYAERDEKLIREISLALG